MKRPFARARYGVAVATSFLVGLLFASAFDLTPVGYAQAQRGTEPRPNQPKEVHQLADVSDAFVSIARDVTPAVVSIQTEREARRATTTPRNRGRVPPGLEDFFRQFDPDGGAQRGPVESSGSGFIVSKDGYILTNNHVVDEADRVTVTLTDRRTFQATVVGRDPTTDVAVIKVEGTNLPTTTFGEDDAARVGEWVLAIGNPLGLDFTVTAGIISAKGRGGADLPGLVRSQYQIQDYIQTDAAINPGNSGGPLVNIRGEVIGINSAIASQTGYYSGYGFAIPISLARQVMEDLIAHGRVRRAVLGVSIGPVDAVDARAAGLTKIQGAKVGGYSDDDSPAKRAGVAPGDIIITADGKPVDRVSTLQRIIRAHDPGETVEVEVMRFGAKKTFRIKLAEAPTDEQLVASVEPANDERPGDVSNDKLGISVEPVPADLARQAQISDSERGLLVTSVSTNGPAYQRLVQGTDVIVGVVNPEPRRTIRTAADLERALGKLGEGDFVSLLVYDIRGKQTRVVNLMIGD